MSLTGKFLQQVKVVLKNINRYRGRIFCFFFSTAILWTGLLLTENYLWMSKEMEREKDSLIFTLFLPADKKKDFSREWVGRFPKSFGEFISPEQGVKRFPLVALIVEELGENPLPWVFRVRADEYPADLLETVLSRYGELQFDAERQSQIQKLEKRKHSQQVGLGLLFFFLAVWVFVGITLPFIRKKKSVSSFSGLLRSGWLSVLSTSGLVILGKFSDWRFSLFPSFLSLLIIIFLSGFLLNLLLANFFLQPDE